MPHSESHHTLSIVESSRSSVGMHSGDPAMVKTYDVGTIEQIKQFL
jgi:hypothetical protein